VQVVSYLVHTSLFYFQTLSACSNNTVHIMCRCMGVSHQGFHIYYCCLVLPLYFHGRKSVSTPSPPTCTHHDYLVSSVNTRTHTRSTSLPLTTTTHVLITSPPCRSTIMLILTHSMYVLYPGMFSHECCNPEDTHCGGGDEHKYTFVVGAHLICGGMDIFVIWGHVSRG